MSILATNGSAADVQAKLNLAASGDVVTLPTGNFTWAAGITCSKSLTLQGSGYTPNVSTNNSNPGAPTLGTTINYTGSGVAMAINSVIGSPGSFAVGPIAPGGSSGAFIGLTSSRITLTGSGVLQSIGFYCAGGGVGTNMLLGVYSDAAGAPGALLASTSVSPVVNGLNILATATKPTLAAGNYWLVHQGQINSISGFYDSVGFGAFNSSPTWTGALPSSWPGGGSTGSFTFTLYATFNPVGVTPPQGFFRLSGISFTGIATSTPNYLGITGTKFTDPWRVDNCSFNGGNNQVIMVALSGLVVGCLMDHCTLIGGAASEMIHVLGVGPGDTTGWQDDITPGSNQLIYFEDCLWQMTNFDTQTFQSGCSAIQAYYGARTGVRFSTLRMAQIDQHGSIPPSYGARWGEFYSLRFIQGAASIANVSGMSVLQLRGGSGFVYNITNPASTGGYSCGVYSDEPTPCTNGPGNGIAVGGTFHVPDNSSPVYLWNLSADLVVTTQPGISGANDIALNRNFFVSANMPVNMTVWQKAAGAISNYVYTPFTYPHPLISVTIGGGGTFVATTLERASFANLKYGRTNVKVVDPSLITVGQVMTITTANGTMTGTVKKFTGSTSIKLGDLTFNRPSSFLLLPKGSAIA